MRSAPGSPPSTFDEDAYRADLGVDELTGEPGLSTLERLWTRPTLEVNGVSGGGWFTVIPWHAAAHVTCRLVPGQDPDRVGEAIRSHIAAPAPARGPGRRHHRAESRAGVHDLAGPPGDPCRPGRAAEVYPGQDVVLDRIAGTLPATTLFENALGAKTMFFSFSIADELLHAPNEFLRVRRLREGMRAWERLLVLLAEGM